MENVNHIIHEKVGIYGDEVTSKIPDRLRFRLRKNLATRLIAKLYDTLEFKLERRIQSNLNDIITNTWKT